jgi:cyanophycinase-like exopeptidase
MGALICLQGGGEFTEASKPMDDLLLSRAPKGPVVVAPLASGAGSAYRMVGQTGCEYYASLGATDLRVAPEPHLSLGASVRSIIKAGTVVIPGGSAARLRAVVMGTAIGAALRAHVAQGGMMIGSSAGAMVLAAWMVLPSVDREVRSGLGLVPNALVLPNFCDRTTVLFEARRRRLAWWMSVVGIPRHSAVVYHHGRLEAVGAQDSWLLSAFGSRTRLSRARHVGPVTRWSRQLQLDG